MTCLSSWHCLCIVFVTTCELFIFTYYTCSRFFFSAFCPWGEIRLYGLLGGLVRICVQSMWDTRRGLGACSPGKILIFGPSLDTIWWNLGLFSHQHNLHLSGVNYDFCVLCCSAIWWNLELFSHSLHPSGENTCKIEFSAYPRGGGGQAKPKGSKCPSLPHCMVIVQRFWVVHKLVSSEKKTLWCKRQVLIFTFLQKSRRYLI